MGASSSIDTSSGDKETQGKHSKSTQISVTFGEENFSKLGTDVLIHVFSFLDFFAIPSFMLVSKGFNQMVIELGEQGLWETYFNILSSKFSSPANVISNSAQTLPFQQKPRTPSEFKKILFQSILVQIPFFVGQSVFKQAEEPKVLIGNSQSSRANDNLVDYVRYLISQFDPLSKFLQPSLGSNSFGKTDSQLDSKKDVRTKTLEEFGSYSFIYFESKQQIGTIKNDKNPMVNINKFKHHDSKIYSIRARGNLALSCGQDSKLVFFDMNKKKAIHTEDIPSRWVMTVDFALLDRELPVLSRRKLENLSFEDIEQNALVVFAGLDNICSIRRIEKLQKTNQPSLCKNLSAFGYVSSAALIDRASRVAFSSGDSNSYIGDIQSDKIIHTLEGHRGDVMKIEPSPFDRSSIFATCSVDATVKLWDLRQSGFVGTFFQHSMDINSVKFLGGNGFYLISGGDDCITILRDIRKAGKASYEHQGSIPGKQFDPSVLSIYESPDLVTDVATSPCGGYIFTCSGQEVLAWEVCSGRCRKIFGGNNRFSSIDCSGSRIVASNWDKFIYILQGSE